MTSLVLNAMWHDDINQVETNELATGGPNGNMNQATKQLAENILWLKQKIEAGAIQVGDLYTTTIDHVDAAAVAAHHGYGTWESYAKGRVLVGLSDNATDPSDYKTIGNEFGENEHQLTISEMPSHNHALNYSSQEGSGGNGIVGATGSQNLDSSNMSDAGGGQPHNNIQPSKVVGRWLRTA